MYHLDGIFSGATSSLQVQFLPVLYTLTEWQIELFSASVLLFLEGLDFKTLEKRGLILVDFSMC